MNTIDLSIINLTKEDIFSHENENNLIECLIAYENKIKVEIYGNSLNHLNSIILDNGNRVSISLALCIHLKSEICVFAYYTKENNQRNFSPLYTN